MRIEHVAIYVNDIDAAKDFFVRYFGAEANNLYHNKKTDFKSYFLTFSLKQAGYKIISEPRTTGDGYYESCILDMEGNQIEITI